jgi:hypothetical protein
VERKANNIKNLKEETRDKGLIVDIFDGFDLEVSKLNDVYFQCALCTINCIADY